MEGSEDNKSKPRTVRSRKLKRNKVTPLHGVAYFAAGAEPDVVSFLKGLVDQAERGEIIGVAVCTVDGGRRTTEGWALGRAGLHSMSSAVSRLWFKFHSLDL